MTDAAAAAQTDAATAAHCAQNREWWDAVVPVHVASRGYDREGFVRGERQLCRIEVDEIGALVEGRTLLHLQCHFGMDTLDWARSGAIVTGLDFSGPAIDAAWQLSIDSGIPGRFVEADVYDAARVIDDTFDIVYTGVGALCWLPDVRAWARVVAACLVRGGRLYLYEGHPMLWALDAERDDARLVVSEPYFETREPSFNESDTTYVDGPKLEMCATATWNHGLGEIVTALVDAGLRIDFLHEHREIPWKALPVMEPVGEGPDGADGRYQSKRMWRLPESGRDRVPLTYSLLATKA